MNRKIKKIFLLILIGFIFSILFIFKDKINKYIDDYKIIKDFNYTYRIDSNINVKGIVDENNIVIQDGENLMKYNLKKSKKDDVLVSVESGYDVKSVNTFDNGIIWVESKNTPTVSSKYILRIIILII